MFLTVLLLIVGAGYLYLKWNYSYWKRKGLEQLEPDFFYGNIKGLSLGKISYADQFKNLYNEIKSKGLRHAGIYQNVQPVYMPTDLEIVKSIMQTDFNHFMNHGEYINERDDPLSAHLFALEGEKWKKLRAKLTPAFTPGQMKMLFPIMVACTEGLENILSVSVRQQEAVDIKDLMAKYTTDIIGSAAFGVDCNSLNNPDSDFRRIGRKMFERSTKKTIKRMIFTSFPRNFLNQIGFKRTDPTIADFFMKFVKSIVDYREENNIYRKDFMHLLLQLKNRGKIADDEHITDEQGRNIKQGDFLTFNELAAQCFVFFFAAFETSSVALMFALLELARNPDIQKKLREEIKTVLKKYNNEIVYDAIMEMKYLDKVVYEALRLHPPDTITSRVCNKQYTVPGTDVVIEKGVRVMISILGIQRDPEYYPNPEVFNPERFSEENKAKRSQFTFLLFGEGPRACVGIKFALLQIKVGIAAIIKNFEISLNPKTKLPIKYATKSVVTNVEGDGGGVWLNARKVE